jgi:hypothetical protein
MIPEHCLQRIFLPMRLVVTVVDHLQAGHVAGIVADAEVSAALPKTMGAAAFFAPPEGGGVAGVPPIGLGGAVN